MSRYGHESDYEQGRRDGERGYRPPYERDRWAGYGSADHDYFDGYRSGERRAEMRREEEEEERQAHERAMERRRQEEAQEQYWAEMAAQEAADYDLELQRQFEESMPGPQSEGKICQACGEPSSRCRCQADGV